MDPTDSRGSDSPAGGPVEKDYVVLPEVPPVSHLRKYERLGEPSAELEHLSREISISLVGNYISTTDSAEPVPEDKKWVDICPRKDFYSDDKIRKLLLTKKMPTKSNLWRGTLIHGIPDEWYGRSNSLYSP